MALKHLIFVVVDSLRVKNVSCYGYPKPTTPNLDNLSKEAILFQNCFSCSNNSDSSLMSIFSGKFPRSHGVISHGTRISAKDLEKLPKHSLLPETLEKYNFWTGGISTLGSLPRPITKWHRRGYNFFYTGATRIGNTTSAALKARRLIHLMKLDGLVEKFKGFTKNVALVGFNAKSATDVAIDFIRKNQKRNFLLFIDYMDIHAPYRPSKSYFERFYTKEEACSSKENMDELFRSLYEKEWLIYLKSWLTNAPNLEYVFAQYDGIVNFVDAQIGRLLKTMNEYLSAEETFSVFTSDHGESLNEHGIFFDHHGLYDVSVHVPLILRYPESPTGRTIDALVQHTDIVPTITDLMGLSDIDARTSVDGKSLHPLVNKGTELHKEVFFEEGCTEWKIAVRNKNFKYIYAPSKNAAICRYCDKIHGGLEELYNLKTDPEETKNVINHFPNEARELKTILFQWKNSFKKIHYPVNLYKLKFDEEHYLAGNCNNSK